MTENNQIILDLKNIDKSYGDTKVLENINISIYNNEFFTILGSSGSGKSTIIRMIGGFTKPSSGEIIFEDENINEEPIFKRPFNTVFQDYALFPNMNVFNNVGFGLKIKNVQKNIIKEKVLEVLRIVGLENLSNRMPQELSGGQQQRVALARAIAPGPEVILLDEPFTSLDAHMARELRDEVVYLLRKTETTAIIVTHDQEEALSVCDVVSVLENGTVIQSATPQEIYLNPVSQTVANSVGDPNILKGYSVNGRVETSLGTFVSAYDGALDVSIRPECIELTLDSDGSYLVKECTFYGHDQVISFQNSKGEVFRARSLPNTIFESGDKVNINISEVTTFPSKA